MSFQLVGNSSVQPSNVLLLDSVLREVRKDFESSSHSIKSLNLLSNYFSFPQSDFDYIYKQVKDFSSGKTFQDFYASINKLKPLAKKYYEDLGSLEDKIRCDLKDTLSLKTPLQTFISAHNAFREVFIDECQNIFPDDSSTVLSRYPDVLRLYFISFVNELGNVSPQTYQSWEECSKSSDPQIFELFPRLGFHYLLKTHTYPIPKLFSPHIKKIEELRGAYKGLGDSEKTALAASLRYETQSNDNAIHKIFIDISKLSSDLQSENRLAFRGISKVIYEEAVTAFSLLKNMEPVKRSSNINIQMRSLFDAILKQDDLLLPRDFTRDKVKKEMLSAFDQYKALSDIDREIFTPLFLSGAEKSDKKSISNLIHTWNNIYFLWMDRPLFPLHLLGLLRAEG